MANNSNRTKVITGTGTRLSYFHGWEPVSINGGAEKYSVSVLIPKSDTETVSAINAAIDAAIEEGVAKFGGKKPNKAAIKLPLRDGDVERDDEAYKGHWFINANSELEFNSNMQAMAEMSLYQTGITPKWGDQLVTLSTCDQATSSEARFVVVGVKIM